MTGGKTKSGFKFNVDENVFKDWDFVTLTDTVRQGNGTMKDVNALLTMVLGEKGFEDLKTHIRKKNGYADVELVKAEFEEIVNATKLKN